MQGQDVLMDEFGKAYALFVCEEHGATRTSLNLKTDIEKVNHVAQGHLV